MPHSTCIFRQIIFLSSFILMPGRCDIKNDCFDVAKGLQD